MCGLPGRRRSGGSRAAEKLCRRLIAAVNFVRSSKRVMTMEMAFKTCMKAHGALADDAEGDLAGEEEPGHDHIGQQLDEILVAAGDETQIPLPEDEAVEVFDDVAEGAA